MNALPETLCTGVDVVDSEHAYLIDLLGRLERVCIRVKSRCDSCDAPQIEQCDRALSVLFGEFLDYMLSHFRHEENFMRTIDLPRNWRDQHTEEHANISLRIQELISRNQNDVVVKPVDFHLAIVAWLEDHIKNWDMPIASHLGLRPLVQKTAADIQYRDGRAALEGRE